MISTESAVSQEDLPIQPKNRLAHLSKNIDTDLKKTRYPEKNWVRTRFASSGERILDVLIVGGGQSGLATAFGLMREKVNNILVVEKAKAGVEGPWRNFARMPTLRTPKYLSGMDFGVPSLTFESWYASRYDQAQYDAISFIPTLAWAEYLDWFRETLQLPVQNETAVESLKWNLSEHCYEAVCRTQTSSPSLFARKIVLATGIEGSGDWIVPNEIKHALPSRRYAHTRESIDFESLKGKRVAIIGAGASAFDNAIVAARSGAHHVLILCRRTSLPTINPYRWSEFVGFLNHHADLCDDFKWKFAHKLLEMGQLPPKATYESAMTHPNISLQLGANISEMRDTPKGIELHLTGDKIHVVDFLILGTGVKMGLQLRPELALIAPDVALWKDRYRGSQESAHSELLEYPYLGPHYEFQAKSPEGPSHLNSIFCYNFGSLPSLGLSGGSISGMKYGLKRLIHGITKQLYIDDANHYYKTLEDFDLKEFEICQS